jgi:methionine sulfoxide reductase heme-binding subunit
VAVRCLGDAGADGKHPMMLSVAAVPHSGTALWYLTRATGLISLILLSATVVLGIVASVGWTAKRWPRFASQAMHRNLSLFCIALIAIHIVTTVADGFVPITYLDAFVPFISPYRPLWIGLGALAFDMLLAVGITSGLRRRIGVRAWRGVHYLAYACWPIAVLHGLGSGSDARLSIMVLIEVLCITSVVGAVAWRLVAARGLPTTRRLAAAGTTAALVVLAEINARFATAKGTANTSPASTTAPTTAPPSGDLPAPPFTANVSGTVKTTSQNSSGEVEVMLTMVLQGSNTPLVVTLLGTSVNGGVAMSSSSVVLGTARGVVTALDGTTIGATVRAPSGHVDLEMQLSIDQSTGSISGTVSGTSRQDQ